MVDSKTGYTPDEDVAFERARQQFEWEQRLRAAARDAYDEIQRGTCNRDIKRGASNGIWALVKLLATPPGTVHQAVLLIPEEPNG